MMEQSANHHGSSTGAALWAPSVAPGKGPDDGHSAMFVARDFSWNGIVIDVVVASLLLENGSSGPYVVLAPCARDSFPALLSHTVLGAKERSKLANAQPILLRPGVVHSSWPSELCLALALPGTEADSPLKVAEILAAADLRERLSWAVQLADALQELHARSITLQGLALDSIMLPSKADQGATGSHREAQLWCIGAKPRQDPQPTADAQENAHKAHEASAQASCESYRGPPSLTNVAYDSGPGRISPLEQISPDDVQLSSSHSMAELQERLLGHLKHADEPADTADVPAGGRAGRTRPARRASRLSLTTTSAGIFQPSHDSTLQPAGVAAAGCGDPQAGVCASGAQHVEGAHVCAPEVARVLDEETVSNSDPDTQGHAAVPERRRVQRRGSRLSCSSPVSAQPAPAAVAGSPQDFANELLHRDPQLEAVLTDSGGDVAHAQMPADGRPMRKAPARRASRLSICHPGDALGDVSAQAVQGGQEQPNEKQGMQVPVAMRVVQQDAAGVQESMPSSHQQPLRRVVRRSSSRLSVASNSGSTPPAAAAAATSASGPAGPALLNSVAALRAEEDALDDNDLGGVKLFRRVVRRSSSRLSAASNTNSPVPSPRPSLGFSGTYQSFSQQYAHDLMMATSPGSMSYRRVLRRSSSRLSATASASAPVSPLVQLADEPRPLPPSLVPATAADIFSTAGELPAELGRSSSAGPAVAMPGLLSTGGRTHSASRLSSSLSGLNHPVLDGILTNAHHPNQPLSRGPSNNGHVLSKLGSRLSQYTSSSNGAATDEHPTLGHAGSIPAKSALGSRPPGVAAEAADSRREWVSAERQLNGSAQQRDGPAAAAASSPRRPPSRRSSLLLVQEEARSMLHDSEVGEATVAAQRVRRAPSRGASCLSQASATRCGEPAEHDGSDADAVAAAAAASLRSPRSPRASVLLVQEESRSLLHDNEVGEATIAAQQVRRAPSRRASCLSHVSSTAAEVPSQTSDAAAVPASSSGLQPKSRRSSIVIVQEETRHMLHDSEVGEATLAAQRVRRAPSRRASCLSQASMTASADHGSHCGAHSSQVERVAAEDRPTAGDPADERNRTRRQPQRRGSRLYLAAGGSSGSSQHDSLHDTAVAAGAVSPAVGEVAKEMQRLTADPDAGEFTNALSSSRARSKSRRSSLLSVCSRQSSSRFPDEQLQPASSSSRSPHAAAVEKILQECKDGQSDPANEACTSPRRTGRARRSSRLASATSSVDGSSERGSERSPHSPSNSSVGARPPSISKLIAESQAFSADPDAAGTSDAAASAQATAQASAKKKSRRPSRLASSVSEPDSPIGTLMCEDLTAAVKRLEGYLNQDPDAEITPAAADATPPPALTPRKSRRLSRLSVASNDGEGVVGGVGGVSGDGSVTPQNGQLAAASRRNSSQLSPRKDNPDLQLLRHQVAHSAAGTRDQSPDRPGAAGHPDSPSHSRSLSRLRIARFSAEPTTERSLSQGGAVTPHDIVIAGTLIEKARRASLLSFVPAIKRAEGPPSATQVDSPKGSRSFLRTVSFDTEGKEAKPATDLVKSGGSSRDGPDNAEAVDVASRHGNEPVGSAAAACKQLQVWLEAGQYDKIMGRPDLILPAGSTFPRSSFAPDGNGGFASDVFAFGIVLYQMLATSDLSASHAELMARIQKGWRPRAKPEFLDHRLWGLIQKCLYEEPSKRPSMDQVAAELAALHTDLFPAQRGSREVLMAMTSSLAPVSAVDLLLTPKTTDYPSSAQDTTKSPIATQHASQAAETKPTAALSPRGADAAEDKATVTMGCRCCIM